MSKISDEIKSLIDQNNIVLFMKGTKDLPQCGFSATVVNILFKLDANFVDVDVLRDMELRQAIKDFSDWPTIPQLYVKGEFIGGCDIVREMYSSGELQTLLQDSKQK